jgi:hypothetical protein
MAAREFHEATKYSEKPSGSKSELPIQSAVYFGATMNGRDLDISADRAVVCWQTSQDV